MAEKGKFRCRTCGKPIVWGERKEVTRSVNPHTGSLGRRLVVDHFELLQCTDPQCDDPQAHLDIGPGRRVTSGST